MNIFLKICKKNKKLQLLYVRVCICTGTYVYDLVVGVKREKHAHWKLPHYHYMVDMSMRTYLHLRYVKDK